MEGFILSLDFDLLKDIAFQLLNTVILCGVLSYLLYKPVSNFMRNRRERIASQISSAESQLKSAEKLKAEYAEKIKNIEKEKDVILEQARSRASKKEQEIILEAKKEADTLKNRAIIEIQREQEKAKDEIKKQIIEVSSLMASRFISASIDESQQNKLVDEVISDLGDVKWLS